MRARPVDHVDIGDVIPVAAHQSRQKAMQAVEIRQTEESIAAERFQASAGIARPVPQHRAAHGIGNA